MKPTLSLLRARMLKSGRAIPIWTQSEWLRIKEERAKKLDLSPLLNSFGAYNGMTRKLESMYGREVAKASEK